MVRRGFSVVVCVAENDMREVILEARVDDSRHRVGNPDRTSGVTVTARLVWWAGKAAVDATMEAAAKSGGEPLPGDVHLALETLGRVGAALMSRQAIAAATDLQAEVNVADDDLQQTYNVMTVRNEWAGTIEMRPSDLAQYKADRPPEGFILLRELIRIGSDFSLSEQTAVDGDTVVYVDLSSDAIELERG